MGTQEDLGSHSGFDIRMCSFLQTILNHAVVRQFWGTINFYMVILYTDIFKTINKKLSTFSHVFM